MKLFETPLFRKMFADKRGALGNAVVSQQQGAISCLGQAIDDDRRNRLEPQKPSRFRILGDIEMDESSSMWRRTITA